jgi:hypothetical protein
MIACLFPGFPHRIIDQTTDGGSHASSVASGSRAGRIDARANTDLALAARGRSRDGRRWTIERIVAWLENFRRLVVQNDRNPELFQAFLKLTCLMITLRAY